MQRRQVWEPALALELLAEAPWQAGPGWMDDGAAETELDGGFVPVLLGPQPAAPEPDWDGHEGAEWQPKNKKHKLS